MKALLLLTIVLRTQLTYGSTDKFLQDLAEKEQASILNPSLDKDFYQSFNSLIKTVGAIKALDLYKAYQLQNSNTKFFVKGRLDRMKRNSFNAFSSSSVATEKRLKVVYINGINTSDIQALATVGRLIEVMDSELKNNYKNVEYQLLYNYSYAQSPMGTIGFSGDLFESVVQTLIINFHLEEDRAWSLAFRAFDTSSSFSDLNLPIRTFLMSMRGLKLVWGRYILSHTEFSPLVSDLQKIVTYEEELQKDKWDILVVTHSQGGLFANQSHQILKNKSESCHTSNIQIATPSNYLDDKNSDYVTNKDDFISHVPASLSPNIPGVSSFDGKKSYFKLYHGVMDIYLSEKYPIYQKIILEKTSRLISELMKCNIPHQ